MAAGGPVAVCFLFYAEGTATGMETFEGGLEKDQAGHRDFY